MSIPTCNHILALKVMNVLCSRYFAQNFDWLHEQLGEVEDDYIFIDCPGNFLQFILCHKEESLGARELRTEIKFALKLPFLRLLRRIKSLFSSQNEIIHVFHQQVK